MRRGAVVAAALAAGALSVGMATAAGGERSARPAAPDGATVFVARGCAGCHEGPGAPSSFGVGPSLAGAAEWAGDRQPGVSAEAYLASSIRDPAAFRAPGSASMWDMPRLGLTEAEVDAVVAYLLGR